MNAIMKQILGAILLGLMLAPGAALADRWKDESGKRHEQSKQVAKQQEKLREREQKYLEKQREHLEKLHEKEQKRREKERKEQKKQWERHQKDVEKRRDRTGDWRERGVPFDVPPRQRGYPVPHHQRDGYGIDPFRYDSPGYRASRRPPPPPVHRPGFGEPPAMHDVPHRHHDWIEEMPSGYYREHWQPAPGGYEPYPSYPEDTGRRQFEYWEDQSGFWED